jgi:hypothetical protein
MEKGDPSVSMGVYATALWMIGRAQVLAELAAPEHDQAALEADVRVARARASRKPVSLVVEGSGDVRGGLLGELPPHTP